MSSSRPAISGRPMNIPDIVQEAANFDYNPSIALKYWIRAADAIQKQAAAYHREGHDQNEYLFLMRHALLVTEKLSIHPEAKSMQALGAMKKANSNVLKNLRRLEVLKPRIKKRVEEWEMMEQRRRKEMEDWQNRHAGSQDDVGPLSDQMAGVSIYDGNSGSRQQKLELDPSTSRDLVAKMSRRELRRPKMSRTRSEAERDSLSSSIVAAGRRGQATLARGDGSPSAGGPEASHHITQYPTVPRNTIESQSLPSPLREPPLPPRPVAVPPARPPKPNELGPSSAAGQYDYTASFPPQRPPKIDRAAPLLPQKVLNDSTEPPSRGSTATPELTSRDYTIRSTANTESGTPLRTVYLPPTLRHSFLTLAASNTGRNLETCGILAGQLISNAFFISHLLIPEQESTSDTCDTLNEEAIFDYCDEHELLTVGWIHTHPTQTCFMSSRDLHTHAGYQVGLPEAIAIVCAPSRDPSWGAFRLTDPPGLKTILGCSKPGLFHPHEVDNVYTDALKPGHVWELPGLEFGIVDFRAK